jgi:hypothetical protein
MNSKDKKQSSFKKEYKMDKSYIVKIKDDLNGVWCFEGYVANKPIFVEEENAKPLLMSFHEACSLEPKHHRPGETYIVELV